MFSWKRWDQLGLGEIRFLLDGAIQLGLFLVPDVFAQTSWMAGDFLLYQGKADQPEVGADEGSRLLEI